MNPSHAERRDCSPQPWGETGRKVLLKRCLGESRCITEPLLAAQFVPGASLLGLSSPQPPHGLLGPSGTMDCSASPRKPSFEPSALPEPPHIKRAEDLKPTLLSSTVLQSRAAQRGRMTAISFLLLSQPLSPAAEKRCAALLKAFSQWCLSLLAVLGGAGPLSRAASASALSPEWCQARTASLTKKPIWISANFRAWKWQIYHLLL